MKRSNLVGLCLLALIAAIAFYLYVGSAVPAGQPELTRLDASKRCSRRLEAYCLRGASAVERSAKKVIRRPQSLIMPKNGAPT